jgi:hypothetical protein
MMMREVEEGAVIARQSRPIAIATLTTVRMLSYNTSRGTPPKK